MKKNEIVVKMKYRFGDIINHKLNTEPLIVVSLQINKDKTHSYGCSDKDGNWKWFKEYEIKKEKVGKIGGFQVRLK